MYSNISSDFFFREIDFTKCYYVLPIIFRIISLFYFTDPLKLEPIAGDTVIIKKSHFGAKGHDTIHLRERAEGEWWNPKPRGTGLNGFRRRLVTHEIAKILHPIGDIIDPISKEPVVGDRYRSETERYQKIYGKSKSEFDYKTAPKRGSQKDKRDFSYRRTYKRWHEFKDVDPYAIVC